MRIGSTSDNTPMLGITSVGGRIQFIKPRTQESASFKCRSTPDQNSPEEHLFSVNAIDFNRRYNTWMTALSDGSLVTMCPVTKRRIAIFGPLGNSITDARFHSAADLLFFASSYDYAKGYDATLLQKSPNKVYMKKVRENELKLP